MSVSEPLLKLSGVTKRFEAPGGGSPVVILEDVSLEIAAGDSLAIVGPSGSGKSTLLHLAGTLDRPTAGLITFNGQDLGQLTEEQLARLRNFMLGFVFQAHYLLPQCTVLENVLVPTLAGFQSARGTDKKTNETPEARAVRLLARVGLAHREQHRPGQLSGGERQRVAVVRALINQPQLLLADEPTGALDHVSAQQLGQLLVELNREEGVTLIVVTHSGELASRMSRRLELRDGRLFPLAATSPDRIS